MDLPAKLVELSKEYKIKIYEQAHFVKDPNTPFDSKDDCITTYVAHDSKDPTCRVMVKKFMRVVEGSILSLHSEQRELVEKRMWTYFKRECRVWNLGGEEHPNIIKFLGLMMQAENQIPAFVTQLASHGNLFKYISVGRAKTLELSSKIKLLCDVADGLSFLHERNVIHRDLKTSNIMLNRIPDGMLVALLGDFGSAKDFEDLQVLDIQNSTVETTLAYNSPEQVRNPHNVDGAKDMWSFGCVALELLTCSIGVWPIGYSREMIQSTLEDGQHPPRPSSVSEANEVWIFIDNRCWCKEPRKRVTASQASLELKQL